MGPRRCAAIMQGDKDAASANSSESEEDDHESCDSDSPNADARKRTHAQTGRDVRPRKTARTQTHVAWSVICDNVTQEEVDHHLRSIAKLELDGASWKPNIWKPQEEKNNDGVRDGVPVFNKDGVRRMVYRCPFSGKAHCSCPAQLRVSQSESNAFTLERLQVGHGDHTENHKKRGLSKYVKVKATSPTKMASKPHMAKQFLRDEVGALSGKELLQISRVRKVESKKAKDVIVPHELRGTFGGVQHWVDAHSRDALTKRNVFGAHSVFVCGTPVVDAEANNITIAYSTENLLLNAYRQQTHGFPSIVQVDCTHQLVLQGHLCILFGTVDAGQHFHTIGYGLCATEDTVAHEHVFRALKNEVERVVSQRIQDQRKI